MMAYSAALFSLLLAVATVFSIVVTSESKPMVEELRLDSYSEERVAGCLNHNQNLGLCFDVRKGFMKIAKSTGEEIVLYQDLGEDAFFYQVLDVTFFGKGSSMFYFPDHVDKDPQSLRAFLKEINSYNGMAQREALKTHFQEAMSRLHYVPEIQLLELLSAALGNNSTSLEILQPFHALCFFLLKQSDVEIPNELRAAPDMEDDTTDHSYREKRCISLKSDPLNNNCLGMCGKGCSCWKWVCGDCCWHYGCYLHDLCCKRNFWNKYCLTPWNYNFSCNYYGGYSKC